MNTYTVTLVSDYEKVFKKLNSLLDHNHIVIFDGPLGAGKTTFVKEFLKFKYDLTDQDLAKEGVSSPTFSIQNQYEIKGDLITHFDFYRVEDNSYDLEDDIEDIETSAISFVEWPEKVNFSSVFNDSILISMCLSDNQTRIVTLKN